MTELNDSELLALYARTQSEEAFATLVARHVNLVYSASLRFTGNRHDAQEITQAVFLVLTHKAGSLRRGTVLSGWLYQTARLTAANFVKREIRRQNREQESYMQSTLPDPDPAVWEQIAPLLDEAMGHLGETDRNAIVLRYFENKPLQEVAAALNLKVAAAHMRVSRGLEKLRKILNKRNVTLSATLIAGAMAANSVQAAPAGVAMAVATSAVTGAATSSSILTLSKGVLKIMAWTKAKMAIVAGVSLLLATGTTTVLLKQFNPDDVDDKWFDILNEAVLEKAPDNLKIIRPTHFANKRASGMIGGDERIVCKNVPLESGIVFAENFPSYRLELPKSFPKSHFDFLLTLPKGKNSGGGQEGVRDVVRDTILKKFGYFAHRELRQREALLMKIKNPNAAGLQKVVPTTFNGPGMIDGIEGLRCENMPMYTLQGHLEGRLGLPVLDQTGFTNRLAVDLRWTKLPGETISDTTKRVLFDQLGLELVPSIEPIEMLVVQKVK